MDVYCVPTFGLCPWCESVGSIEWVAVWMSATYSVRIVTANKPHDFYIRLFLFSDLKSLLLSVRVTFNPDWKPCFDWLVDEWWWRKPSRVGLLLLLSHLMSQDEESNRSLVLYFVSCSTSCFHGYKWTKASSIQNELLIGVVRLKRRRRAKSHNYCKRTKTLKKQRNVLVFTVGGVLFRGG